MDMIEYIVLFVIGFTFGSIPFGIIVARAKGVDLKKVGSRNIGATNVLRSLGKWPAVVTLLGDMLKGTVAVALARYLEVGPFFEGLAGFSAILGHNYSIFLGFRGGKGVATSLGVLAIYAPFPFLATVIIWLVVVIFSKISSMGALIAFGLMPLNVFLFDQKEKLFVSLLITAVIFLRHRDNIRRLLNGTERRIGHSE
jgi:glycerol-3-phosphate acyltransferase PlsY